MRKALVALFVLGSAAAALAHITPNVELVRKGDFLKQSLPEATKFFERRLMIGAPDGDAIRRATGWTPTEEDTRLYVGRNDAGGLAGCVVFLWMPSEHGPVGVAVAFDPSRAIRRVAVTDVGSEPLAWVRPIVDGGSLGSLERLGPGQKPDASRLAPAGSGSMTRYYAKIIADAVVRAQEVVRVAFEKSP